MIERRWDEGPSTGVKARLELVLQPCRSCHAKENAIGCRRISGHATAYSFRHAHVSELLQMNGVDPLTVAAQTATSVADD